MTDVLITKKNIILDATVMSSIVGCARLADFRFNRDLQEITGKSNNLECGSIAHHFLEDYYKGIRDGLDKVKCIEAGMKRASLYIKGCIHCVNNNQVICGHEGTEWMGVKNTPEESVTKPHRKTGWSWILDTMLQYVDFYKNDSWVPIEVEHVKGHIIYEDDDIRILWKAKYDLIVDTNNGLFPIDHKTSSVDREIGVLNNQFMGQAYLLKGRSMMINKIGLQTSFKPHEKFERVVINYTLDQLTEWSQEIVPFWGKMMIMYSENNMWPPNFQHCENKFGRCSFYDVCSVDRSIRDTEIKMKFFKGKKWDISNLKD